MPALMDLQLQRPRRPLPCVHSTLLCRRWCRYDRGGLIEQAFYIQIVNAIVPDLTDLLNPYQTVLYHIMSR